MGRRWLPFRRWTQTAAACPSGSYPRRFVNETRDLIASYEGKRPPQFGGRLV
jgi:hypothetical protein